MAGTPIFAIAEGRTQGRSNVFTLDPRDIFVDYRKNLSRGGQEPPVDDNLKSLAFSMAPKTGPGDGEEGTSGQLNPVLVRMLPDRRAELVGGFRRYRAAMWLVESGVCSDFQLKCTKCMLSDAEAAYANLDENLQREDPQPIQLAHAIRALHEGYGHKISHIAKRLRKSVQYINYLLKLTGLPTLLQDAVTDGEASVAAIAELTDLPGPIAIEVFSEAKAAAGRRVRAKDLKAEATGKTDDNKLAEFAAGVLPTPTGTPSKAAAVASGKGPAIKASDIKAARRARDDAKLDAAAEDGTVATAVRPKNRTAKEVLAAINDLITPINADPDGKKLAKMLHGFVAGEKTADQLAKLWFKQFPVK